MAILTLLEAPVCPIAATDAFVARAGCDKRIATCSAKFADVANFRGFPHIPAQGEADKQTVRGTVCPPNGLRYATRDGGHEGAV